MTSHSGRPTRAQIDLKNLINNFKSVKQFVGPATALLSVVKADAYGHGAVRCSKVLEEIGCRWFGVALLEEALELRSAGVTSDVLILGGFWPGQSDAILDARLTPVVFRRDSAKELNDAAASRGAVAPVHVKVDTGMGRLGVRWDEFRLFADYLGELKNLRVEGVMSHFAAADDLGENAFTNLQMDRFDECAETLVSRGFPIRYRDIANSPGAVVHHRSRDALVRIGGILYGLGDDVIPSGIPAPELSAVLSLKSAVSHLKRVPTGETLGYGRSFSAPRDSVIATVPIGYHDGFPRVLSGNAEMLVRGRRVPVVGRVSMDWTLIDVTDVPDVALYDEVVVIGRQGDAIIPASELAARAGTNSYEITCGLGSRVPRDYVETTEI